MEDEGRVPLDETMTTVVFSALVLAHIHSSVFILSGKG